MRTFISRGVIRCNYPSRAQYPVRGIDVSHHQGAIDWRLVRADGIDFAYIKATQGVTFRDPMFAWNWRAAQNSGVVPGAYHFYTLCTGGALQAQNFMASWPLADARSLPPAVDLELGGNCIAPPPREVLFTELKTFLVIVEGASGKPAVIYVTDDFYNAYLRDAPMTNPLWVRNVFGPPRRVVGERPWTFWQYGNRGHVAGVDGFVDLDVFNGTRETFEALITPRRDPAPSSAPVRPPS